MPQELEFMKSRNEKQMDDGEYKTLLDEYIKKAVDSGSFVRKLIFISLAAFALSYIIVFLLSLFNKDANSGAGIGNYSFMAVEFAIIALFLYDVQAENEKKYRYETDRKIILKSMQNVVKFNKMRLIFVCIFILIFLVMNIAVWTAVSANLAELAAKNTV